MANENGAQTTSPDQSDDIFDEGGFAVDDTDQVIQEMLPTDDDDVDDADQGGMDQPFDEAMDEVRETVGPEEGRTLTDNADRARDPRSQKKANADEGEGSSDADAEDASDADETAEQANGLETSSVGSLLDGVSDDRKAEVERRLQAARDAMAPFETVFAKGQMNELGATPAQVAGRLTELAEFANTKPDEYIAWVAGQSAGSPEKVVDVLNAAAKFHGLEVRPIAPDTGSEDDDLFDDPEIAELKRENAELKARLEPKKEFGPDTAHRQETRTQQQSMDAFINEVDPSTGQPKRPHFPLFQAEIASRAKAQREQKGAPITIDDVGVIYDAIVAEVGIGAPKASDDTPANPSAAKPNNGVAQQTQQAAAANKAKKASKSVDGTGQGANRRPALGPNASIEEVISQKMDEFGIDE